MKERYWNNLVTSLRSGQCILVLGPDIPAYKSGQGDAAQIDSQISYTDALKDQLAAELAEDGRCGIAATNLAGVAQQYEDADGFGAGMLRTQSAEFYASSQLEPSITHGEIATFPFSLILSTCHDQLLEIAFKSVGKSPIINRYNLRGDRQENPEFMMSGSIESPLIYHLFGYFKEPQSLVISENDLLDFLLAVISGNPPLPNCLRRALQRSGTSFLFMGFGIRHWYLRVLLKALVRGLSIGRSGGSSVAIEPLLHWIPDSEKQQTILFYQRGTRIEICEEEILLFLSELERRLKAAGGIVTQPAPLVSRPRVFVSYASEDQGFAARLFAALQKASFDPWLDKDALRGGDDWNQMIEDQLRETDYVLVLQTPALATKMVGYVNKEIAIARDQAQRYRGLSFLIPLVADNLSDDDRIKELNSYQQMPLRGDSFDQDFSDLVSTLRRDFQRRQRQ